MASAIRASSFLPTIKCSNCNVEIPISLMGEHTCAPAPPLPESRLRALDGPFAPPVPRIDMPPPPRRSTKTPPPRINAASTFDSFLNSTPPPPIQPSASSSRSASPAIANNGRKSPYQMPPRSATTPIPIPTSPPSQDLSISQDSAFPRFPTSKSRSVTPTTPSESSFSFSHRSKPPSKVESDTAHPPLDVRNTKSGNVMRNIIGIKPEPSNTGAQGYPQRSRHRKSNSMSNSQDFSRPTSSTSSYTPSQRPSTSSSNYTRRPSVSSTSGSSRFTFERSKTDVPAVPAVPSQGKDSQQEDIKSAGNEHHPRESAFDFGSFGQDHRSQTFPRDDDRTQKSDDQVSMRRRPSEPAVHSHKPRPSVAATVMQPLYSIGSTSSFKSSKSLRGRSAAPLLDRKASSTPRNIGEARDEKRLQDAPPLPMHTKVQSLGSDVSHHTPHESTSSNESYSSGRKTGSSRSSPPLHDSTDDSRIDNMFNGFQFDVERRPSFEEPASTRQDTREGSRSRSSKPPASAHPTIATHSPMEESPRQEETTTTSPEDYILPSFTAHPDSLMASSTPPTLAPPPASGPPGQKRPTTANKGNCRGCGELIKGKSVRAEDGRRLTGRYHKQCFVCKTCQSPFPTADFYVMHDHPYCARHYHELNNSLCTNCDRGIEGPYLETEQKHKFHPHCFSCQECHRILRKDYFEFESRTLCEQHAHRAAQQPSSLGPGRRFPERRTTRLMMM